MSKRYFGEDFIAELRSKADIVALVSEYVRLRKAGKRYVGLCPFHREKTPSFSVDPDKQLFYCFGCGQGGNIFSFLMKIENVDFPEAVEQLAEKVGLALPRAVLSPEAQRRKTEADNIRKALEFAGHRYRAMLFSPEGAMALKYLENRGLSRRTMDLFQLGYAPDEWEYIARLGSGAGIGARYLELSGLIVERERKKGTYYDRFRNRIMFPIWNGRGDILGFAGRAVGDEMPKYLNSPDTPLFHKGKELYALHLARPAIKSAGRVGVMEGYMDVISMFEKGVNYVVAGMGTAFSTEQARTLISLCDDVVLSYDQDEAGKRAARRSIEVLREAGGRSRVVAFSGAKDPDEFVQKYGADKFKELMENAAPDIRFIYDEAIRSTDIGTVEGKLKLKDIMIPVLASLAGEFEASAYTSEIWRDLDVRKESLDRDVELYRRKFQKAPSGASGYKKRENRNTTGYDNHVGARVDKRAGRPKGIDLGRLKAEEGIIRALVEKPELTTMVKTLLGEQDFADNACRSVYETLADSLDWTENHEISGCVAQICARFGPVGKPERVLMDCIRRIRELQLGELREQMRKAQEVQDEQKLRTIISKYQELLKQVKSTRGDGLDSSPGDFPGREEG